MSAAEIAKGRLSRTSLARETCMGSVFKFGSCRSVGNSRRCFSSTWGWENTTCSKIWVSPSSNGQGVQCRANKESLSLAKDFAATKLFRFWIQGAVFLIVLAAVDAAFSGDWSRVGVISKDTENSLKPLILALGAFHIACAVVAARIAQSKQLNVLPRVSKVLAVGFLALVETYLADGEETD